MIIGIGTDLVEVARIRKLLNQSGQFKERVFTSAEQQRGNTLREPDTYYAGRWAAKEACAKALGCGIGSECALTDAEILNAIGNAPMLTLHGAAKKRAEKLGVKNIHISITHEKEYAAAFVILES
jgi:holo-[acyl-carrier protein] synthase